MKKQKVFDVSKRLERWKRQADKWQHEKEARQQVKQTVELPQENRSNISSGFSKLDFSKYTKNQEIKDITNIEPMSKEQFIKDRENKIESLMEQGYTEEQAETKVDDDEEMTCGSMDRF